MRADTMDSKRKANGAASPDSEDRAGKRRKLAESYDLSKGESPDSTSAYGLTLVDQIRRTADKSGRRVAGYFEDLPPVKGNEDYYERTRMPISLSMIEDKLQAGEFANLSELEGYFKRMISNAKEWFPRSSSTYDDAERVRKAVSNYMTKTNPAYQTRGYQAIATPLPGEEGTPKPAGGPRRRSSAAAAVAAAAAAAATDEDEEKEEEDGGKEDGDDEEDEEDEKQEEEEEEDSTPAGSKRRSIILKRRGPTRSTRNSISAPQETPRKSAASAKPDHQYEDVPYKGLSFQQAQEKIVEEMLRHREPEYDSAYFEAFVNLPPRALKDYYKMIADPLSLKKLQKMVKGVQSRHESTGTTEFKSWAQFEDKAALLWENAFYYNEEKSEIYILAQELKDFFYKHLKSAQQAVQEPAQPKIKLKVGQQQQAEPSSNSKKITIHVGNGHGHGGSVDSPTPASPAKQQQQQQQQQTPSASVKETAAVNGTHTQLSLAPVDKASSISSLSPSVKNQQQLPGSPAVRAPSVASGQMTPGEAGRPPYPAAPSQPPQTQVQAPPPPPPPVIPMEPKLLRGTGKGVKDALVSSLRLQFYSHARHEPTLTTILPDAKEMQQSATVNLTADFGRVLAIATLPDFIQDRQYSLWTLLDRQPLKTSMQPPSVLAQAVPDLTHRDRVFEAMLRPGINTLEAHLVAAIPRAERVQGGPEVELEVFTVYVNVLRGN